MAFNWGFHSAEDVDMSESTGLETSDTHQHHLQPITSPPTTPFSVALEFPALDDDATEMESPAPSIYSVTDSIRDTSFKIRHDRCINNYSDIYHFPADAEEIRRLDQQHVMLTIARNYKLFSGPVSEVLLRPDGSQPKTILDLGCGTAAWTTAMAKEFPLCDVVGVDLVPIQTRDNIPNNCRIEMDDINLGLEHFENSFDLVHTRLISSGIRDYCGLIGQIANVLRPGGLALLQETDFRIYDSSKRILPLFSPDHPDYSWLCHYLRCITQAAKARGARVDAASLMDLWLQGHPMYEQFGSEDVWLPLGAWHHSPQTDIERDANLAGEMMQDNLKKLLPAARPLLLDNNMSANIVEDILERALEEVRVAKSEWYMRVHCAWARKKTGP